MSKALHALLTRRERQIMDVLLRRRRATAAEVMNDLPGGQSYSTIRTQLRVLEEKGYVRHEDDGVRYVYTPSVDRQSASQSALPVRWWCWTRCGGIRIRRICAWTRR